MSRFNLLAVFALSLTTACAVGSDDSPADSDRFLTITEHVDDAVRGSFMTADGEIDFSFERTANGGAHAILSSKELEIIDVKVEAGREAIRFMGELAGSPDHKGAIDRDLFDEVASLPEMRHLPELRDSLINAGIDPDLLGGVLLEGTLGQIGCRAAHDASWTWVSDLGSEK